LVQPTSEKDQINGYVSLGVDGKLPTGSTPTSGTGTLHQIDIAFPASEVTTITDDDTDVQVITGFWSAQDAETFFGNFSGASALPTFEYRVFPVDLIPGFDASRITSGTFTTDQLPMAQGVGVDHSAGLLPDPSNNDVDSTAQPTDYLGRDILYHAMQTMVNYQPQIPAPSLSIQTYFQDKAYVNITTSLPGATLFYKTTADTFIEVTKLPILVSVGASISAYAASAGYNNSDITVYTVPPTPTG